MEKEIRARVDDFLVGRTALSELEAWLVRNLQRILEAGDVAAMALANDLDADIVQFDEGLFDERELLERLATYGRGADTAHISVGALPERAVKADAGIVQSFRRRLELWTDRTTTLTPRLRYV
jgi:hypothetical protein